MMPEMSGRPSMPMSGGGMATPANPKEEPLREVLSQGNAILQHCLELIGQIFDDLDGAQLNAQVEKALNPPPAGVMGQAFELRNKANVLASALEHYQKRI